MENRISIELGNGLRLVAAANIFQNYPKEVFIGIEDEGGVWLQDLALVRNSYEYDLNGNVRYKDGLFDVLVWADKSNEDFTHDFTIELCGEQVEQNDTKGSA